MDIPVISGARMEYPKRVSVFFSIRRELLHYSKYLKGSERFVEKI